MDLLNTLNGAMTVVGTPSRQWLARTHHYEWITDYLAARGATGAVRVVMAIIPASLAICLLVLLRSVDAPRPGVPTAMMWAAFCGGVAGSILWASRWPSRHQSLAFALVTNASVALACLSFSDPQGALLGCVAFATCAAYIGFFHSTVLVVYNFVVASTVAIVIASRIVATGHIGLAAVDLFLVTQINIVMPIAIHLLIRSLGVDLERAGRDSLTGLLNRRSFDRYAARMLDESDIDPDAHLVVVMIDLDNFKRLNDTRGHAAGDQALVAIAAVLRQQCGPDAAVGRLGGEEFVIAEVAPAPEHALLAEGFTEDQVRVGIELFEAVGCDYCTNGYKGRVGVYQVMPMSEAIQEIILQGGNAMQIAEVAQRRADDIAHRRTAVTGVNEFPNLSEVPLPQGNPLPSVRRYGADFEALRNRSDEYLEKHGARPKALLLPLGPLAEHNIRTTFTSNLLASGGIEAVNPGPLEASGIGAAVAEAGVTEVAVVCGTDKRYADEASAAIDAAKAAGVKYVLLAGPEKAVADAPSKPDGHVTAKIDAVQTLSDLLTRLGA